MLVCLFSNIMRQVRCKPKDILISTKRKRSLMPVRCFINPKEDSIFPVAASQNANQK